MANVELDVKIVIRNDSSSNLTSKNPVLLMGEMCLENDTGNFKFGDGVTPWNNLDYATLPTIGDLLNLQTVVKSNLVGAINEIDQNIKTHQAESAKKHTGTVITNQYGSYTKFDNGLMMCFALTSGISLPANSTTNHTITLPAEFKDGSYTAVITEVNTNGDVEYISAMLRSSDKTKNSITVCIRNTYSSGLAVQINLMAIGMYK